MDKIKIEVSPIEVDTGFIILADASWYVANGGIVPIYSHIFDIPNCDYLAKWSIPSDTKIVGSGILTISSGKLAIDDPYCYFRGLFSEWDNLLNRTDCHNKPDKGTVVIDNLPGDGIYAVDLELTPVTPAEVTAFYDNQQAMIDQLRAEIRQRIDNGERVYLKSKDDNTTDAVTNVFFEQCKTLPQLKRFSMELR